MALDLGELAGTLTMDISPLRNRVGEAVDVLTKFASGSKSQAKRAGDDIGAGFGAGAAVVARTMAQLPRDAKGAVSQTSREFQALDSGMRAAITGVDARIAGTFDQLPVEAQQAARDAIRDLDRGLDRAEPAAEEAGRDAGRGFADRFSDETKDAGKAAGAAVGLAMAAGVADNLSIDAGNRRLRAQLGLSATEAKTAGDVAGQLYADNFAESIPAANDAIAAVVRNIGISVNSADLGPVTSKVLAVSDVMEQDLGGTAAAVGQMIRTGLAKDATQALDVLTAGFQGPADKAGDLLDTFNEYSTQFRDMGIDGAQAMGLISQAVQAGARDSDVAADALKELNVRVKDGSAAGALRRLGLDADEMAAAFARGGPAAGKGLDRLLDQLRGVKDPAERSRLSVALLGTQAEDLGNALFSMDVSTATESLGKFKGATDDLVETTGGGPQATIEGYRKKLIQMGRSAVESTGPTAMAAGAVAAVGPAVLGVLGPLAALRAARAAQTAATAAAAGAETAATGATVRSRVATIATSVASKAAAAAAVVWTGVQWALNAAMSANPLGLIVIGIMLLIGAAVLAYRKVGWFRDGVNAAFSGIKTVVSAVASWVVEKIPAAFTWLVDKAKTWGPLMLAALVPFVGIPLLIWKHWDKIKRFTSRIWGGIVGFVKSIPRRLLGFFLNWTLPGLIIKHWDKIKAGTIRVATSIVDWVKGLPGRQVRALASLGGKMREVFAAAMQAGKDKVVGIGGTIVDWIKGIPGRLRDRLGDFKGAGRALIGAVVDGMKNAAGIISGIAGNVWDAVKGQLNRAIDAINAKLEFTIDLPGPKNLNVNIADIPRFATGGRVVSPTVALIGEGREAESVIPDSMMLRALERAAKAGAAMGGGRGNRTYQVYETQNASATAREIARIEAFAGVA